MFWQTVFATVPSWESNGLLTNLRAYYKSDTSGSFPDAHNSYDMTISGATFDSGGGILWSAYQYDGTNDRIEVDNNLGVTTAPYSISAWVKFNGSNSWFRCLFQLWDKDTDGQYFRVIFNNRVPQCNARDNTVSPQTMSLVGSTALSTGTWHHVVAILPSQNDIELYINGTEITNTVSNTWRQPKNLDRFSLGRAWDSSPSIYLDGWIDEVAVWDRAISSDDVTALYNSWSALSYDSFTS